MKKLTTTLLLLTISCGGGGGSSAKNQIYNTGQNCPMQTLPAAVSVLTNDDALKTIVSEAVEVWNDEIGVEILAYVDDVDDSQITIELVDNFEDGFSVGQTSWRCLTETDRATGELIDYYKTSADIFIHAGLDIDYLPFTVAHELGHALGMDHTNFGIMQANLEEEFLDIGYEFMIFEMFDYFNELYPK